ncbi:hypothetical protein [Haloarcula montana]|uniref:hypothetical protein n=1 Tax=Haloarcula montana TaxID=3111776 RepID=UPI002D77D548|nr:hypothetical protein [Haloarcula sp. GH36]
MERRRRADGGTAVDPTDSATVRDHLSRFAGVDVERDDDGTLRATFGRSTFVAVAPDGTVTTGMPLHGFDGPAERLIFDHEAGALRIEADGVSYTFRRP